MTTETEVAEEVAKRLEGKKIRVTYYASEQVYYETTIEAFSRKEADEIYYSGNEDLTPTGSDYFETYDVTEEEL